VLYNKGHDRINIGKLVNETNIEVLYWELMKSGMFHFMKVKKLLFLIEIFYFLASLTSAPGAPVNMTHEYINDASIL
jgi:hypothetical protein